MRQLSRKLIASVCLSATLLLVACGEQSADELMTGARSNLNNNNAPTAIIQLKTVIQQRPESGEARFLLGKALMDNGEATLAILELRKAMVLNYPSEQVVPLLARGLLATRQHQNLIDEFAKLNLIEPGSNADLKTSIATAYVALESIDKAQPAIRAALQAVPGYPATLKLQARLAADAHKFDEALALVNEVIAAAPLDAQAWQQKGDYLFQGGGGFNEATAAYYKALTIQPTNISARSNLIALLLSKPDLKAAAEQVDLLRKSLPGNPQTTFFEAQLAFHNRQPKKALELIEQVLKIAPDNVKVLQAAGEIELANGTLLQAERSLTRALALSPGLSTTRLRLAQTFLRMGQPAKALAALEPLLIPNDRNASAHALAGEAHLQAGNLEAATASFANAIKLDPTRSATRINLAVSKMKSVGIEATAAELQKISATDKSAYADLALTSIYVRNKDFVHALKAIDVIDVKDPNNATTANLRGRVQLMNKDIAAARISFERALSIDPVFVPAAASLAILDLDDNKHDAAKKRFEAVLAVDPNNLQSLLAIAKIRALEGATSDELGRLLENAAKLNPTEAEPRLLLVNHYLSRRNFKAALTVAQDGALALPNSADMLDALGRSQMFSGDSNQAILSFNKLANLEPRSARAYVRMASAHLVAGNKAVAEQSLRRALTIQPNYLEAQRGLLGLLLADKRWQDALAVARAVQKQRPAATVGFMMEAAVETARQNVPAAIEIYRSALKRTPSTELAARLHSLLLASKDRAGADKLANGWLASYPKDIEFIAHLGDLALGQRDFELAEKYFRAVVAVQPENALVLNNVAWLMVKLNKPGAVTFAERALKLDPLAPGLMDTLAMALAADKQFDRAIEMQKKAVSLAPGEQGLRLGLAKLYIQAGDKAAARAELAGLAKLGDKFVSHAEVKRLVSALPD